MNAFALYGRVPIGVDGQALDQGADGRQTAVGGNEKANADKRHSKGAIDEKDSRIEVQDGGLEAENGHIIEDLFREEYLFWASLAVWLHPRRVWGSMSYLKESLSARLSGCVPSHAVVYALQ